MRKEKLTSDEILEAEKAKDDRLESRSRGYKKMSERDRGWARLSNGVSILWATAREAEPGEALRRIPEGMFVLDVKGKETLFDGEEFRKWLRWV